MREEVRQTQTQEMIQEIESDEERVVDPNKCDKCGGKYAARYAKMWIGCDKTRCGRWFHKKCIMYVDLVSMTEEEFENFYFECDY